MPRKSTGRRRRFRKYLRGNVDEDVSLTTLGAKTLAASAFDETVQERTLVSSIRATYTLDSYTKSAGDGPIMVGIAHSDYSTAEIEEFIETTGSWDEGDLVQQEVSKRKIKILGVFSIPVDETEIGLLGNGSPITTKLNWILNQGKTLQLWGYNMGSSALATSVPIVRAQGHCNLWPR